MKELSEMSQMSSQKRVMIAGVGGASLGTEIFKSLILADNYQIFGCDISSLAYGLYERGFIDTYRINKDNYIHDVIAACKKSKSKWIIPGGEQPSFLLTKAMEQLTDEGINLVSNNPEFVSTFSDKNHTFEILSAKGIQTPKTIIISDINDILKVGLPCIVKPALGSGGSTLVFFAVSADEAMIYAEYINRTNSIALAQEYIGHEEGEFTIGVLSLPNGEIVQSIAMKRVLESKLSVISQGRGGVISSGYSQGYIGEFSKVCQQAERIAKKIGSRGPINIQGRLREGILLPFEINPRFSASTYLRALAGFNEIDIFLKFLMDGTIPKKQPIKEGFYLRSFTEEFIPKEALK